MVNPLTLYLDFLLTFRGAYCTEHYSCHRSALYIELFGFRSETLGCMLLLGFLFIIIINYFI